MDTVCPRGSRDDKLVPRITRIERWWCLQQVEPSGRWLDLERLSRWDWCLSLEMGCVLLRLGWVSWEWVKYWTGWVAPRVGCYQAGHGLLCASGKHAPASLSALLLYSLPARGPHLRLSSAPSLPELGTNAFLYKLPDLGYSVIATENRLKQVVL